MDSRWLPPACNIRIHSALVRNAGLRSERIRVAQLNLDDSKRSYHLFLLAGLRNNAGGGDSRLCSSAQRLQLDAGDSAPRSSEQCQEVGPGR